MRTRTGNKIASTVAREHDLNLDGLRELLTDNNIKARTPFTPVRQKEVTDLIAAKAAKRSDSASPPPSDDKESGQLVPTRRRQSKGAFEQVRKLGNESLQLTPADKMTLSQLQQVLDGVARRQELPRVTGQRGRNVAVQDVFFPERWIILPLAEFQKRSDEGTLPPLHEKTKRELAEPLGRLSLVNQTCYVCTEDLEPPYLIGMLEHLLAGNTMLPFKPNHPQALKYPRNHKGCPGILEMMSGVEVELVNMPEGESKEAMRWRRYREEMEANDGTMLSEFMKSEHKPLSGVQAMARVRAIKEHVKRQRELLS